MAPGSRANRVRVTFAVAAVAVALGWPVAPNDVAFAGCVGPSLRIERNPNPAHVFPGLVTTVHGDAFFTGCNDTGTVSTWGCDEETADEERAMEGVELRIRQAGKEWRLGTEDAADGEEAFGDVVWEVEFPGELVPGRATLTAGEDTSLRVIVISHPALPGGR